MKRLLVVIVIISTSIGSRVSAKEVSLTIHNELPTKTFYVGVFTIKNKKISKQASTVLFKELKADKHSTIDVPQKKLGEKSIIIASTDKSSLPSSFEDLARMSLKAIESQYITKIIQFDAKDRDFYFMYDNVKAFRARNENEIKIYNKSGLRLLRSNKNIAESASEFGTQFTGFIDATLDAD